MFRSLINDAKSAVGAVVGKYAIRASVGLPFIIGGGFATAALTLSLADRYGAMTAYWIMAGGFAAIGLVAALIVNVKEQEEEAADVEAAKSDTAEVATDAAAQAAAQLPLALLGSLLTTPLGPNVAAGGAKMLVRNLPLVLLVGIIGMLLWRSGSANSAEPQDAEQVSSEEADPVSPVPPHQQQARNGVDRHAV